MEAIARGRIRRCPLPTSASNDDAVVTETLGVAGRQKETLLAWEREKTHVVLRQHGHQDILWCWQGRRSTSRTFRVDREPMDGLQRPCHVKCWDLKGMQPSRMSRASSMSHVASAREAAKHTHWLKLAKQMFMEREADGWVPSDTVCDKKIAYITFFSVSTQLAFYITELWP